jgi:hypothetical protein
MIWQIEMLKQGIPDPTDASGDKDRNDNLQDEQIENFADAVFVHTKFVFSSLNVYRKFY